MSRYIEADAFDKRVRISVGLVEEELTDDFKDGVRCTLEMLKTQPTADVVEVVRCKDCKHFVDEGMYCSNNIITMFDHFYCYYGERREDDKG